MVLVIILNKKSEEILRTICDDYDTIYTIQTKLCKEYPESVCLTQNGILLDHTTLIKKLGSIVLLVLEKEIEFNDINVEVVKNDKLSIKKHINIGTNKKNILENQTYNDMSNESYYNSNYENSIEKKEVIHNRTIDEKKNNDVHINDNTHILYEGKLYCIIKRIKRWNWRNIKEWIVNYFSVFNTFQFMFISFLFLLTGDFFMLIFIFCIYLLDYIGVLLKNSDACKKIKSKVTKLTFMFFTSLLLKDHQSINVI